MENTDDHCKDSIIKEYFLARFSYTELLAFLSMYHGIELSLRQLHRNLRRLGMFRRKSSDDINTIIIAIKREADTSSSGYGYRMIHQKLRQMGVTTNRETVRLILKAVDPDGVMNRSKHRLRRRIYISKGPNYVRHIDGYDKRKPYGFALHGCIDGYSRKIIWLKVLSINSNPKVIADVFVKHISNVMIVRQIIRYDRGSENVVIGALQRYFRRNFEDSFSGEKSFRYGTSTANQRIEAWWSIFRRSRSNSWINYFKDLVEEGTFDPSFPYHLEAARFSFMGILQNELDETVNIWNNHRIRSVRNAECPGGRPYALYYLPGEDGTSGCSFPVSLNDLIIAQLHCRQASILGCWDDMVKLGLILLKQGNLTIPKTVNEAKNIFLLIINCF